MTSPSQAAPVVAGVSAAADAQAAQAGLATLVLRDVAEVAWPQLDVAQLKLTLPDLVHAIAALVFRYGRISGTLSARFYSQQRTAAGVPGRFTPMPADPPALPQVEAGVKWATKGLWSATPDPETVLREVEAVAETFVLDVGRATITEAAKEDRAAIGWARITEPGACHFCLLLATRGGAYVAEKTAEFEAHPGDRCHAEPVFTAYEPSAELRHWEAVYREAARGKSGAAARLAFRQAVEAERAGG